MVVFLAGFVVSDFIPPPSPEDSAIEIARFFDGDTTAIRLGMWMNLFAAALCAPWAFAIACQLRHIPGDRRTPLSSLFLVLGAIFVLEFLIPVMIWQAAAYRPLEDPEITRRLNDLAWLMFIGVASTVVLQALVLAVAILRDTDQIAYPRWFAYLNAWCAFLFVPAALCVFVKDGPFAWNGLIAWWLVLVAFGIWVLAGSVMTLLALARERRG